MISENLHLISFSPTHTSQKIAHAIAEGMNVVPFSESDITFQTPKEKDLIEDELVIVSVPVYGGRVPDTAVERLKMFCGKNSPVVPVVVYGNRDYDDALLELSDLLKEQGFTVLAAAAFIGEHSFSTSEFPIASGRPDMKDHDLAYEFGQRVMKKLQGISSLEDLPEVKVKGNFPYKEKKAGAPVAPMVNDEACSLCGYCIDVCPVGAISKKDDKMYSDPTLCIKCCACVKECPDGARVFPNPFAEFLFKNFSARKEPEMFL